MKKARHSLARTAINNAIASVFEAVDGERLGELAGPILRAEKVWILSGETSQAGARALHSGLSMVRPGVRLLDERTFGADACDAGAARRGRGDGFLPLPSPGDRGRARARAVRCGHRGHHRQSACRRWSS